MGYFFKWGKHGGLIWKKDIKRGRALKRKRRKGGGFGQNCPPSSSSRCLEQRRAWEEGGGHGPVALGARWRPGRGGKERGGRGGPIPLLNSSGRDLWRAGDGGRQEAVMVAVAAALEGRGGS